MFFRKRWKNIAFVGLAIVVLSASFSCMIPNDFKRADAVFVDVGQGDCLHVRTEDGGNYLVDGGGSISYNIGKNTLKPYLLKNGVRRVDGAFVTHLHTDHYKGIAELCRENMVEKLYLYEGCKVREKEILKETGMKPDDIIYLYKGQRVFLSDNDFVDILWPERKSDSEYLNMASDEADENESSLILKITIEQYSILMTGDVDSTCLDNLAKLYGNGLKSTVVKAAHHGSKYSDSEALLEVAEPKFGVFQVGKNNFGHPDQGVVEKFRRIGIIIYRNDENGAIAFDFDGVDNVKVSTVKGDST